MNSATKTKTATKGVIGVRMDIKEYLNTYFPIVKAGQLSLNDEFMQHEPETENQKKMKRLFISVINSGLHDFRVQAMNPSYDEENDEIYFLKGENAVTGKSMEWIIEYSKKCLPEKKSRNGNRKEMIAFLAVLIKELSETEGYTISKAWNAVCDDSKNIGNYSDSIESYGLEKTGSRKVLEWCDLGNLYHAVTKNYEREVEIWGANYLLNGKDSPLSTRMKCGNMAQEHANVTMWIVIPSVDGL